MTDAPKMCSHDTPGMVHDPVTTCDRCVPCLTATIDQLRTELAIKLQGMSATLEDVRHGRDAAVEERDSLQSQIARVTAERDALRMPAWADDAEDDTPLAEDAAIKAAHPIRTGKHNLYGEAMRLVGARHSKKGLVDLVNWLLARADTKDGGA